MATITTFITGYCTHQACMAVRGAGGGKICQFPAQCVLIETQGKLWLWDTGYANHFFDAAAEGIYRLYPKVTPVYFQSDDAVICQLNKRNIHPNDLSGMILSHFHADHIAGVKDFEHVPVWASQQGFDHVKHLRGFSAVRQGFLPKLLPENFSQRIQFIENLRQVVLPEALAPFEMGFALPESDEVFLLALEGHARGQVGAFVHTDKGWILLAADAAWSHLNYQGKPPSRLAMLVMDNAKHYHHTLYKLNQLQQKGIAIHLSHEVFGTSVLEHNISAKS